MSFCSRVGIPHSKFLSWSPEDRAKQLAFMIEESLRCSMCGTAAWEWEENKFAYTPVDEWCQGCYKKQMFTDQEGSSLPGTNAKLVPTNKMMTAQAKLKALRRQKKIAEARAEAERGRDDSSGERRIDGGHLRIQPGNGGVG